jgi:hypothetical protein
MNKSKLMIELKNKKGGTFVKEGGRWYWINGSEKTLVTTGWLLNKINEPETAKTEPVQVKEEQKVEPVAVVEEAKAVTVKKPTPKKKKESDIL